MQLMPDPSTAVMDPFREEPTLILSCDVVEPGDGKGYERDPRSLAKRAEAYLKSSGIGDVAYFGPEPEFFIFDSVTWHVDMSGCSVKIDSEEASWSTNKRFEGGNSGHRPAVKGGYFPVPPVDSLQDMRSEMCLILEQMGVPVEVHHHEVAGAGQCEIGTKFAPLVQRADWLQILKYVVHNVAASYGKTATFMPKPIVGDNGSGMHVPPVDLEGRHQPVRGRQVRRPVGLRALLHRRHHQARACAERHHQPRHQLVQAPGSALRGAGQARLLGAQPLGVDPHPVRRQSEGPPHRGALPGSDRQSVPGVRGADDGRPRRRAEQDPSRAIRPTRTSTTCRRKRMRRSRPSAVRSTRRWNTWTATGSS